MMRKAIFGGTFDPIHNGHLNIAYEALYELKLDKLIFMPSGAPPHKVRNKITDGFLRYEMVKMATREEEKFEVSHYELNKKNLSYTYETMGYFKTLENNTKWYFISGADCLMDIEKWKNAKKILEVCTLVIFNRPGYNKYALMKQKHKVEKKYSTEIIFLDKSLLHISSTDIRRRIIDKKNVTYLMPEKVYNFAKELNIYK